MKSPQDRYVVDADVVIDLDTGDLLDVLPGLPFSLVTPDLLAQHELLRLHSPSPLESGAIGTYEFTGADWMTEVVTLRRLYPGLGFFDVVALYLARLLRTCLLTRDIHLRTAASQEGVEVLDTFWLLEQMLECRLLTVSRLRIAIVRMALRDNYVPAADAQAFLDRWESCSGR
jgi:hypothetical protein